MHESEVTRFRRFVYNFAVPRRGKWIARERKDQKEQESEKKVARRQKINNVAGVFYKRLQDVPSTFVERRRNLFLLIAIELWHIYTRVSSSLLPILTHHKIY